MRAGSALATVAVTAALAVAGPAAAVQTRTFGLTAPDGSDRLLFPPGATPVHDRVVVYNRTTTRLVVRLDVVGVSLQGNGGYTLGAAQSGFAGDVLLSRDVVVLAPYSRIRVGFTVRRQAAAGRDEYAAITAAARSGVGAPLERLALLVGVTAHSAHADSGVSVGRLGAVAGAAFAIGGVSTVLAGRVRRRRRRA